MDCVGCFARRLDECLVLTKPYKHDCPFKKSDVQYKRDQKAAAARLRRLEKEGKFNPEQLVNLRDQAIAVMEGL